MRQMNQMPYIIGAVIRIYPSNKQKRIIAKNDGAARFIYNRLVARDRELHALGRVKRYCEPVAARISYLKSLGINLSDLKAAYPFLEDKEIDSLAVCNAKQNYQAAWNNFMKIRARRYRHSIKRDIQNHTRQTASTIQNASTSKRVLCACLTVNMSRFQSWVLSSLRILACCSVFLPEHPKHA